MWNELKNSSVCATSTGRTVDFLFFWWLWTNLDTTVGGEGGYSTTSLVINTKLFIIIFLITPRLALTEGALACVECQYASKAHSSAQVSQVCNYHNEAACFYFDLILSYRTVTYTNNNLITLGLAVITVSVQSPTHSKPQVRLHSWFNVCFSLCQHGVFSPNVSWLNKNHIMLWK